MPREGAWVLLFVALVATAGCLTPTSDDDPALDPQATPSPSLENDGPVSGPNDASNATGSVPGKGFTNTHVIPGAYETGRNGPSTVLTEGPHEIEDERVIEIESPLDGATLQIGVVLPDVPEDTSVPVIAVATPYYYGTNLHRIDLSAHYRLAPYVDNHLPHGYAIATIPVRGTSGNGGCMTMGGPAEKADLDHAITWLGKAPWSNGNVALIGLSYDGWTAWEAASIGNPHLATIVPIGSVTDWHAYWHPNGTSRIQGAGYLNTVYSSFGLFPWRGADKVAQGALCPEAAQGLAAAAYSTATGERDPTGYWHDRQAREGVLADYEGSVFVVHGLQDGNTRPSLIEPWINDLIQDGTPVKRWYGQWGHAMPDYTAEFESANPNARWDWAQTLLHWFDHWLKPDAQRDLGPPVQAQADDGQWRSAWAWPGTNTTTHTLYLHPDGGLKAEPSSDTAEHILGPDPGRTAMHDADRQALCQTCPSFATPPIEEENLISGRPRIHVTITPTSPADGHLSAFLYASTDQRTRLVGWGTLDMRYADGSQEAQPTIPGEATKVRLALEPMESLIEEGEHLELVLSQGTAEKAANLYALETMDVSSTPPSGMILNTGEQQSKIWFEQPRPNEDSFFSPP